VIAIYLQVLAVIALVAVAAIALGNEARLLIDERHEELAFARVGRHRGTVAWIPMPPRHTRQLLDAALFAHADEAFNAAADTIYVTRVIA